MQTFTLVTLLAVGVLRAQSPGSSQPDVDAAIQAATAARNPEPLEKRARELEEKRLYDPAQKLLDAALVIRGQVSGDQSEEYGLCLLKMGDLGRKILTRDAAKGAIAYYARAVKLLPNRPEAANAFLYLGIVASGDNRAKELLQRAKALDISLTGPALMWTGLMQERQNQPDEAESEYKAALAAETADSLETVETLTLYERFLRQQNRDVDAEAIETRLASVRTAHSGQIQKVENPLSAPPNRAGGSVTPPAVTSKTEPVYSEEARIAKISGSALLQLVVGADGQAHNIKVVRSIGFGLDDRAVAAILKWQFRPGQKDGSPVPVYATVEINFRLL